MKATIESTSEVVTIDKAGNVKARVWEGVTEGGVKFTAYIPIVQVRSDDDNSQFEAELKEHKRPEDFTRKAIDMRMIM